MAEYNWVDYLIILFVVISMAGGFVRGFIHELASLLSWVGGLIIAILFTKRLAAIMLNSEIFQSGIQAVSHAISKDSTSFFSILSLSISFVVLFVGTMIIGNLFGMVLKTLAAIPGIGLIDKVLGLAFGFARGILYILLILVGLQYFGMNQNAALTSSKLIPYFQPLFNFLINLIQSNTGTLSSTMNDSWKNVKSYF